MIYRCLVCDIPLTCGTFPPHAAWHGWHMSSMRQVGVEWKPPPARIATHEFGDKGGPSLFWLIRHLNPLEAEMETDHTWTADGLTFRELLAQPYTNCKVSAGSVEGHPIDTLYLQLERDGHIDTCLLLRPDEAAALAWCLAGVLWSSLVENRE